MLFICDLRSHQESDLLLPAPVHYQKEDEEGVEEEEGVGGEEGVDDNEEGADEDEERVDEDKDKDEVEEDHEQTGGDDLSDTLVESLSTDTWKGVTPTIHMPVPPVDEVSTKIWSFLSTSVSSI